MYLLTAETGSPRYMDPIIVGYGKTLAERVHYNELVDVYSFCIFLWQILALEIPYACYATWGSFQKKVIMGGTRPMCDETWPSSLCSMMRLGWGDIRYRLSMQIVTDELKSQIGERSDPCGPKSTDGPLEELLQKMGIGTEKDDDETASLSSSSNEGTSEESEKVPSHDVTHQSAQKQNLTTTFDRVLDACCFGCCRVGDSLKDAAP